MSNVPGNSIQDRLYRMFKKSLIDAASTVVRVCIENDPLITSPDFIGKTPTITILPAVVAGADQVKALENNVKKFIIKPRNNKVASFEYSYSLADYNASTRATVDCGPITEHLINPDSLTIYFNCDISTPLELIQWV